jgi:hypothetical protein
MSHVVHAARPSLLVLAGLAGACLCACDDANAATGGTTLAGRSALPGSVAAVTVPDSDFARAAAEQALALSPEFLSNHLMRTYLFGALLLRAQGRVHDPELTFAAAMLHDLGLVEPYISADRRMELDGADAAAEFLSEHGRSAEEIEIVWEAIALHLSGDIVTRMAPDIAFVAIGAAADAVGAGLDQLAPADVDAVLQAYPRLGFKEAAIQGIIDQCERKPFAYTLHPWAEVARRHIEDFPAPTVEDLIRAAPFAD